MNSTKLRGYLTGLILGDGSIDKGVQKRAFSIKSINKDFIEKIYEDLNKQCPIGSPGGRQLWNKKILCQQKNTRSTRNPNYVFATQILQPHSVCHWFCL